MLIVAFLDDSPTIVQFASNDPVEFAAATELVYRLGRFFFTSGKCPLRVYRGDGVFIKIEIWKYFLCFAFFFLISEGSMKSFLRVTVVNWLLRLTFFHDSENNN